MTSFDEETSSNLLEGEVWLLRRTGSGGESHILSLANPALPVSAREQRLARELQLGSQLSADWAAVPTMLTRISGLSALLLQDPGGYPLKQKLGQKLAPDEFLSLAIAISDAMAKMHGADIIHRDISPSHILIGHRNRTFFTGFGIAQNLVDRRVIDTDVSRRMTTLAYLAPEQTGRTKHAIDARADLYSLGVIFFQLLTGVLPFHASTAAEWLHAHLAMNPPDPVGYSQDISPKLASIVRQLLSKIPEERCESASALASELRTLRQALDTAETNAFARQQNVQNLAKTRRTEEQYLEIGRSALSRAAFASARAAFIAGLEFSADFAAALPFELGIAECDLRTGHTDAARRRLRDAAAQCSDSILLAKIVRLLIVTHTVAKNPHIALEVGLRYLAEFGPCVGTDHEQQLHELRERLITDLYGVGLDRMKALPPMEDKGSLASMSVLAELIAPATLSNPVLRDLIPARMTALSLKSGIAPESCVGYVLFGAALASTSEHFELGYQLGLAGIALSHTDLSRAFRPRTLMYFGAFLLPWRRPYSEALSFLKQAHLESRRNSDVALSAETRGHIISNMFAASLPLSEIRREIDMGLTFSRGLGLDAAIDKHIVQSGFLNTLTGPGRDFGEIIPVDSHRFEFETRLHASRTSAHTAFTYWLRKLQTKYLAGDYPAAWQARHYAYAVKWAAEHDTETVELHLYGGLTAGELLRITRSGSPEHLSVAFDGHCERLELFAATAAENFGSKRLLLRASRAHITGDCLGGLQYCEDAARRAMARRNFQEAGLAYLLAARSCLNADLPGLGDTYFEKAAQAYRTWGADGVGQALRRHLLREVEAVQNVEASSSATLSVDDRFYASLATLDVDAILCASNALVGELDLDKLLTQLLTTVLRHGAAEKGVLFLQDGDKTSVALSAHTRDQEIFVCVDPEKAIYNPAIVRHAISSQSDVFIDDAGCHSVFAYDDDIRQRGVRSAACVLLRKQSNLIGALYLENNQIAGAFAPSRSALLSMLAVQAAMAIENERLYSRLLVEHTNRQRMQSELAHVSRVTSLGEMAASIAHEVGQPLAGILTYGDASLRWLKRQPPNLQEVTDNIRKIVAEGERAGSIIQRVRALATRETGDFSLLSVNDVVRESLALIQLQATTQRVATLSELDGTIPEIYGDRIQLQQVIINLTINAIQAMSTLAEDSARRIVITTRCSVEGNVLICIEDNGPGIASSALPHVFDAFYTTRQGGVGIGLSICRSIIEAHGGDIWIEQQSIPERGTRFYVSLPVRASDVQPSSYR